MVSAHPTRDAVIDLVVGHRPLPVECGRRSPDAPAIRNSLISKAFPTRWPNTVRLPIGSPGSLARFAAFQKMICRNGIRYDKHPPEATLPLSRSPAFSFPSWRAPHCVVQMLCVNARRCQAHPACYCTLPPEALSGTSNPYRISPAADSTELREQLRRSSGSG